MGEIVNVEVPGAATGLTLKLDEVLEGRPEMLKVTEVAPFVPRVTSRNPRDPRVTPSELGTEIVKSAAGFTFNETVVVCTLLPLTVTVKFSAIESVTVKVEVPEPFAGGVTELELSEQVAVGGQPDTVSATALLNPPTEPTVIVEVPCWPVLTVVDAGLAESVKSGALGAQLENLNDPMRVLQLKAPSAFRYSFTYQNVQSSPGSILRAL